MALFGRKQAKPPPAKPAAAPPGQAPAPKPAVPPAAAAPGFDPAALEGQLKRIAEQLTRMQGALDSSRAESKEVAGKVGGLEEQVRTQLALSEALTQAFNPMSAAFRDGAREAPPAAPAAPRAPAAAPAPAPAPPEPAPAEPAPAPLHAAVLDAAPAMVPGGPHAPAPAPPPTTPGPPALPHAPGPGAGGDLAHPAFAAAPQGPGPLPPAAAAVAPLLPDLPRDADATLAALAWLDHLAQSAGTDGAMRLLAYYQSIGWLSSDAHVRLLSLITGLPTRPPPKEDAAALELHAASLKHLERLRAGRSPPHAEAVAGGNGPARAHGR